MMTRNSMKIALLLTLAFSGLILTPPAAAEDEATMILLGSVPCVWITVSVPPEISYVEHCLPIDP